MLPPTRRFGHVQRLISERKYFTLHAGRQTGKTTAARWLAQEYNEQGSYSAVWADIQVARDQPDVAKAMRAVLGCLDRAVRRDLPDLPRPQREELDALLETPESAVLEYLQRVSANAERPLVVLLDEADGLAGPAMVSFLTQIREGYIDRSATPFPHAIALIGMRQVRDFVLSSQDRRAVSWLGTTSPFNITAEAATLEPFSRDDVFELLEQHTEHTGQRFEDAASARVFELSQGHPWLVNAMADQVVNRDVEDRTVTVTADHVDAAKETIIVERRSHIDSLLARLREPRVQRILEPILVGDVTFDATFDDDYSYVSGLGLVVRRDGTVAIANPIYQEIVPRVLTSHVQSAIALDPKWFVANDGTLDMNKLIAGFLEFWRENGEVLLRGMPYQEAAPHLVLMAYLQRVVNSGGSIQREFAVGTKRADLVVTFGGRKDVIELELASASKALERGLAQVASYAKCLGRDAGYLILFDTSGDTPWEDRGGVEEVESDGVTVVVVRA